MSVGNPSRQRWDSSRYLGIASAIYRQGALHVCFEDGDCVAVPVENLSMGAAEVPDWNALSHSDLEIVVPTQRGPVEVSWLAIRLLTDPEFASHWRAKAAEERRRIGARTRMLRQRRGLSGNALAERVGVSAGTVADIESGEAELDWSTLDRVLGELEATFDDTLVEPEPLAPAMPADSDAR